MYRYKLISAHRAIYDGFLLEENINKTFALIKIERTLFGYFKKKLTAKFFISNRTLYKLYVGIEIHPNKMFFANDGTFLWVEGW